MLNRNRLPFPESECKGHRLHKLEVLNWGTFDGQVYTVRPEGNSALLIGQNGSGKSTLVDAILTLLVRPGVRNFNVAAGAKKRERDERSYVLGAFDRASDDDGVGIKVKLLRPKGDHYSVILAYFLNGDTGKSFSAAQLLYLASDQSVEKIYCLADGERSIRDDFRGLESTEGLLKILRDRGFRATKTFLEFEGWFSKLTRLKPKAMEVFNQTVAVKDIQRLNDFIRDHMLERQDWDEKVDRLLGHFSQLSDAHDSLVRVRQQFELLEPVARAATEFREQAHTLEHDEGLLAATGAYVSQKLVELLTPDLEERQSRLEQTRLKMIALERDIEAQQERARTIRNEIEKEGGDRLRLIPSLIAVEEAHVQNKQLTRERFEATLARLGISEAIAEDATFAVIQQRLPELRKAIEKEQDECTTYQERSVLERAEIRRELTPARHELESLNQRRENIPQWCVELRQSLCAELGLSARELPFAAEVIEVRPEEKEWEASIEKVLRGFALSLLIPDRYYQVVVKHVDRTRLTAGGRGQRLVYLRVGEQVETKNGHLPAAGSLFHKLNFRSNQSLVPWVKAEVIGRFDYLCCDTVEEFQQCRGLAMTKNRHVKSGGQRHEKDDRDEAVDPRRFVLGWDNREKKQRIAAEINRLAQREAELNGALEAISRSLNDLRERLGAVSEAQRVTRYEEIDVAAHLLEIKRLEAERQAIEGSSNTLQVLRARLEESLSKAKALQGRRKELVGDERELENDIAQGKQLLANAESDLKRRESDGTLTEHRAFFSDLDREFAEPPLTTNTVFGREKQFRVDQEERIRVLRVKLDPVRSRLLTAMATFLRVCAEEATDLQASEKYVDSFLGLRQRIINDDLPKHERRFKERLNQKVIEEIGLFRSALEQERRAITEKIELLNLSLKKLEYRPGTHIQLEPRQIRDPEIAEFQGKLRECVEGSFEDSAEANEARFVRIKNLVVQLRDEANRRWRDKVIDVRRWFDFVATVIDRQSLKTVSVYQDSSGQSGGEKAKLAFTILVAAIAYQYDLDPEHPVSDRFHFVVVDEMFSKVDDQHAEYALELFKQFGLQLLIVAPLDAKARVTQPYVGSYMHVVKKDNRSAIYEMSAREFEESVEAASDEPILSTVDGP